MFLHNFKYTLKILFKNKSLVFWTLLFPIILGTLFYFAFMDIESKEVFEAIEIAVVKDQNFSSDIYLKSVIEKLDKENILNVTYTNLEDASNLLKNEKITGYLKVNNKPIAVVNQNGINETIFKNIIEEVLVQENLINTLILEKTNDMDLEQEINIEEMVNDIVNKINNLTLNIKDITPNKLSYTMIEFYTLIAMTCLYGGLFGIFILKQIIPNMSSNGKRVSISKFKKSSLLISSLTATYIVQIISLLILFLYTIYILKIDYGNNLLLVIILSLIGALFGLSFGIFIGTFKQNENFKTGLLIALTMLFCFLSGMMGITMKYIIDKNIPIINKLNPVNMITDGLYSLYYYNTYNRFILNITSLLILSIILITYSIKKLRREVYDSI